MMVFNQSDVYLIKKNVTLSRDYLDVYAESNLIDEETKFAVTQVKVIAVVVIIISGVIFIIAIFRYRRRCRWNNNSEVNHRRESEYQRQRTSQTPHLDNRIERNSLQYSRRRKFSNSVHRTQRNSCVLLTLGRSSTITRITSNHVHSTTKVKKCSSTLGLSRFDDQTPLLTTTNSTENRSSNVVQVDSTTTTTTDTNIKIARRTSLLPSTNRTDRKDFMHKIERFRFIDDSASSTTTVTSPVETLDRVVHGQESQTCHHLISSAIEQFDDFLRSRYEHQEEINTYIDRLNADMLTNGSYSDLNILNNPTSSRQFQPVNPLNDHQRTSTSVVIPSPSSSSSSTQSLTRPTSISTSKSDLIRPMAKKFYESSSSSQGTLTSLRSSTSLEFDDDRKASAVLVEDDFIPMSSPVDEHFWDIPMLKNASKQINGLFPNVGSSPDVEEKAFQAPLSPSTPPLLSETSADEDEELSANEQTYEIHQYQLKELQKPMVIHRAPFNPSPTDEFITVPIQRLVLDRSQQDESLLEKFAAAAQQDGTTFGIRSPPLRSAPLSNETILTSQTIYEEDDTQDSSTTNENGSDESADNGEIDLVQEFELSQDPNDHWTNDDREVFIVQEDDLLSALVSTPTAPPPPPPPVPSSSSSSSTTNNHHRPLPPSIMKVHNHKSLDSLDDPPTLKPKVRFNLDPEYEREREWNKVNKLLGNSVEWTDEFEV